MEKFFLNRLFATYAIMMRVFMLDVHGHMKGKQINFMMCKSAHNRQSTMRVKEP
jgi:hypothetical protein